MKIEATPGFAIARNAANRERKNLSPTKTDRLTDKHLALLMWEKRAKQYITTDEVKYRRAVRTIVSIASDLYCMAVTDEAKGQDWGWWE